jgi:hypothetical protein
MPDNPHRVAGDFLPLAAYQADFRDRFWRTGPSGCWKLERRQTFRELDNASWEASEEGDWKRARALLEEGREDVRRYQHEILDHGFQVRRVRIVDKPYSPYLIWELNSLMIRHEYGEKIRTLQADSISSMERGFEFPEIFTMGNEVVYEIIYDHTGLATGATRSTSGHTVRHWTGLISGLYSRGEDLVSFFHREIAGLQPVHHR